MVDTNTEICVLEGKGWRKGRGPAVDLPSAASTRLSSAYRPIMLERRAWDRAECAFGDAHH